MSKSFEVLWASVAEHDLAGIILSITEESPSNAQKVLARIKARTAKLATSPLQGRVVPELLSQGISLYREVVISTWRVVYRVEGGRVLVVSVVDSRRNVEDILLGRFLN